MYIALIKSHIWFNGHFLTQIWQAKTPEFHSITKENTNLKSFICWMSGFLLSHLSLLYNVVRVTAGEASTLQKIHDIILTARITDVNKKVIAQTHKHIFSYDCRDKVNHQTTLTSPSSYLKSTGPSWHQWLCEERLLLYQSERKYMDW